MRSQCFGRLVGEAACQGWVWLAVTSRQKPGGMDGHQLLARLPAQPQAPGTEMAQDKSMCLFLLALPWHPPELVMASLGVPFPIDSRGCFASGKVPLWFDLNSILLPAFLPKTECPVWNVGVK